MNTLNLIKLLMVSLIFTFSFQKVSFSTNILESAQSILITDTLEEEEEDVYDGDEEQDESQDEEQNEFVGGSEEDELDYELSHEEQDVEYQEQTEDEIDAIEEDINEQP
jgi:hypothetical protein